MLQFKSIIEKQLENTDDVNKNYRRQKKEMLENLTGGKTEISIDITDIEKLKEFKKLFDDLGGKK